MSVSGWPNGRPGLHHRLPDLSSPWTSSPDRPARLLPGLLVQAQRPFEDSLPPRRVLGSTSSSSTLREGSRRRTSVESPVFIEQLATYGTPDPTRADDGEIAHLGSRPTSVRLPAGRADGRLVRSFRPIDDPEALPSPPPILGRAAGRVRSSSVPCIVVLPDSHIGELRHVYEDFWDSGGSGEIHRGSPRRRASSSRGGADRPRRRPPAKLYRRGARSGSTAVTLRACLTTSPQTRSFV